ncbi:MAG: AMP-binding protein, partial [Lachnospiraceae bacterium]|nr:AMP-binding protein [Lachnospiraceae bacterium]
DLSFLICLSVGGDTLSTKLEDRLNDFLSSHNSKIKVAQGYAMSETSASTAASTYTREKVIFKAGTIGVPLVYTCLKVVDENNKELPYGEQGELCINAPCVMQGYYENEAETKNILKKHEDGTVWIHTGDVGSIDKDGFVTIVGRIKRMILTVEDGVCHKVFPKLLEEALLTTSCVKEISVVGKEHAEKMNTLMAFIVLEENITEENAIAKLQQYAQENFEGYECPVKYVVRDSLPRTTIGKVDYRALETIAKEII